jgi:hypothetical protein
VPLTLQVGPMHWQAYLTGMLARTASMHASELEKLLAER